MSSDADAHRRPGLARGHRSRRGDATSAKSDVRGPASAAAPGPAAAPDRRRARRAGRPDQRPDGRRIDRVADDDRLLVLEPRAHAGVGDGAGDGDGRELGGVVFDVQPLPIRSAEKSSRPARFLNRRSSIATSSRQSMPSILKVDSACSSQTVQVVHEPSSPCAPDRPRGQSRARAHGVALLDVLEPLLEQADDVLVVEGVEHHPAVAARADQAHAAQQPQLMRDGRLAQAERVARSQTQSSVRDSASRIRTRVGVAEDLEGLGERDGRRVAEASRVRCLNI